MHSDKLHWNEELQRMTSQTHGHQSLPLDQSHSHPKSRWMRRSVRPSKQVIRHRGQITSQSISSKPYGTSSGRTSAACLKDASV
ncbi:hypothetical protein FocTR4_00012109 [Fusarium oxysporum f. sp. cubense]|uniref:Uncharacterized protein n=1 Tax=Fusarium oxysporum f. sp. cubense TaxID=61366 RepID=A0A5C6SD02_FUSOC|nr:hypothetical protein FocTR4_00012109 [Fusarium oxysporum f. sp. cubense]